MLFLDSSDPKEIADIFGWGVVSGVTTNPLIMARAGVTDIKKTVREILDASEGTVSVELTSETADEMLAEARSYRLLGKRICIKVPVTEIGLKVINRLSAGDAIPGSIAVSDCALTNATCIMSRNQAHLAGMAGATYVSAFWGRIRDMGHSARAVVMDVRGLCDAGEIQSKIIVGSIRSVGDVEDAFMAGAHIVTVPAKILRQMVHHPRTAETIKEFNQAWANRGVA